MVQGYKSGWPLVKGLSAVAVLTGLAVNQLSTATADGTGDSGVTWPTIIYVTTAGDDAHDGLSWATAKRTVQAGVNAAAAGDVVWVAAGTYVERITLKAEVGLYGGFAGSETGLEQRNLAANVTVLDGNKAGRVLTVPSGTAQSTRIDGFTIRNGSADSGAGIYCSNASATIANNTIVGNNASDGGGVFCYSSSLTIANNTITGNSAAYGGGISSDGSATIVNNTITGNTAQQDGGGIYLVGSPTIVNTIVAFNSSGIYVYDGMPVLRNNCVYGNSTYNYYRISDPRTSDPTGTNGNISADPKLARPFYVNTHIQPDSPCVDAGDDAVVYWYWVDMDGQSRVAGPHVDIGADESDGTVWPTIPDPIIRVSPQGNDTNSGSSWGLAKRTVQAAIDAAVPTGGQVWVAAGTYVENITLRQGVALYGGFSGTEMDLSQRDWVAKRTILDGNQAGSVVTAGPEVDKTARIDGFTIRNGGKTAAASGNCYGGGIHCFRSSLTIANNTIMGNLAHGGGGIYCTGGYGSRVFPTIVNNTIMGNSATWLGGGIFSGEVCFATIANNTIAGNSALHGGGIHCFWTPATVVNTIIAFNSSGICVDSDAGLSPSPTLRNNCVYGNTMYDCMGDWMQGVLTINGNMSVDPLLGRLPSPGVDGQWGTADDDYGDLHLMAGSPCVNAGDPAYVPAAGETDMDGQPRKIGGRVDIGADEFCWVGDANFDGFVNVGDLQLLVQAWGAQQGDSNYNTAADCDSDGFVNVGDLQMLVSNWGKAM